MTEAYKKGYAPVGHPLRTARAHSVGEHRLILWDKIGPGAHPCFHCQAPVFWMPGARTKRGALVVDHLDFDTRNNAPDNLVPCCHRCNQDRKPDKGAIPDGEQLVVKNGNRRHRAVVACCEECGDSFLAIPSKRQRFCGQTCNAYYRSRLIASRGGRAPDRHAIKEDELHVFIGGKRLRAVINVCPGCKADYPVAASLAKKRKYCSKQCRNDYAHEHRKSQ